MTPAGTTRVVKDQCRRGPCGGDAPAPNETRSTVAHQIRTCKQSLQNEEGLHVSRTPTKETR
jgi:hypothetical protein